MDTIFISATLQDDSKEVGVPRAPEKLVRVTNSTCTKQPWRIYVKEQETNAQISSAVSGHAYPRLKLRWKEVHHTFPCLTRP
ncbi:hypothetical protein MRB53_023646 [Persea americana]|uniref:Uncharacterized protein n=1 Tax=Persea americana TaxID=3435 RepID=A0ACC2LAJ6_PERAE|nr:hypothetical protein MRB53_023646 [Persea americana]